MVDAAEKLSSGTHVSQFHVRLENGSIYELSSVEDVLAIENTGQRSIEYLSIKLLPDHQIEEPQEDWRLFIQFQKSNERHYSSTPIFMEAEGTSRDWVVLAASELDERARSIRRTSFSRVLSKPYIPVIALSACIAFGTLLFLANFPKPAPAYLELERLYQAGKVANPIEALLILEKSKVSPFRVDAFLMYALGLLVASMTLSLGIPKLAQLMSSPYVFYWGDSMGAYQRRKNFVFIVWTVVVLGVVVGVISSYISKSLGI